MTQMVDSGEIRILFLQISIQRSNWMPISVFHVVSCDSARATVASGIDVLL